MSNHRSIVWCRKRVAHRACVPCCHSRALRAFRCTRAHAHSNHNSTCILKRAAACFKIENLLRAMAKKSVLITYNERKKVFQLYETQGKSDIASLKKDFILQFKFESNVQLDITFQRFDKDWDCFVDLDDDAEIHDKDRLNAVVTPILANSTPEQSEVLAKPESEVSPI